MMEERGSKANERRRKRADPGAPEASGTSRVSGGSSAAETVARMADAAAAFIGGLDAEQRSVLNNPFELDGVRRAWSYLPELVRDGLPLGALSDPQRKLAHQLIVASVSMPGYAKVVSIIAMEHVRRAMTLAAQPEIAHMFDPERYCLRVFGTPGGTEPWGWQLAGHHVSLNFTVTGGRYLSGTPCMFGAVPTQVGTLAPLADDEERGYAFVNSLSGAQRAAAIIYHRPPPDFATRILPRIGDVEFPDHVFEAEPDYTIDDAERSVLSYVRAGPKGVLGAHLAAKHLDALVELVAGFAGRLPAEVAAAEMDRLLAAGAEHLAFAWAGGTRPGERHYYRVQGPDLLIEHDNTQADGNHIHSVWRNPANDFGDDLLADHYRAHHQWEG
jgi:hypothetical protein